MIQNPTIMEQGVDTSDATAVSDDILFGKTAYVNGEKVTGTIPTIYERTVTPRAFDQKLTDGKTYFVNPFTVKGDENLKRSNIRYRTLIFGVEGTLHAFTAITRFNINSPDILFYETGNSFDPDYGDIVINGVIFCPSLDKEWPVTITAELRE